MKTIAFSLRHSADEVLIAKSLKILEYLWNKNIDIVFTDTTLLLLDTLIPPHKKKSISSNIPIDLLVFLGGDGTLLKTLHDHAPYIFSVPVVGIHAGNVGFFSSVELDSFEQSFDTIFSNDINTDARMLMHGVMKNTDGEVVKSFYALNECTVHHAGIARLRNLSTWANSLLLTTYRADGIIVSTPTGSTAYNLAAGGPIVCVDMNAFVITPLAPSGFSQRPIVLSGDKKITFQADSSMLISIDGQEYFSFPEGYTVEIIKNDIPLIFLRQKSEDYFSTLRTKLGWG